MAAALRIAAIRLATLLYVGSVMSLQLRLPSALVADVHRPLTLGDSDREVAAPCASAHSRTALRTVCCSPPTLATPVKQNWRLLMFLLGSVDHACGEGAMVRLPIGNHRAVARLGGEVPLPPIRLCFASLKLRLLAATNVGSQAFPGRLSRRVKNAGFSFVARFRLSDGRLGMTSQVGVWK